MASYLEKLKAHPRVEQVSIEEGGDLLFVYLKAPWSVYSTGRRDGYSRGFDVETGWEKIGNCYTQSQNAKRALHWVCHEIYEDKSSK